MGIIPDDKLLGDKRNALKLAQIYQKLVYEYQEKKVREYVSDSLEAVMKRHGIVFQDSQEENKRYFSMENASLSVAGMDSGCLTMEVIGQYSGNLPTINDRRKSMTSAKHFCSIISEIEWELKRDFGVVLKSITAEEPEEGRMVMKKTGTKVHKKNYEAEKGMVKEIIHGA